MICKHNFKYNEKKELFECLECETDWEIHPKCKQIFLDKPDTFIHRMNDSIMFALYDKFVNLSNMWPDVAKDRMFLFTSLKEDGKTPGVSYFDNPIIITPVDKEVKTYPQVFADWPYITATKEKDFEKDFELEINNESRYLSDFVTIYPELRQSLLVSVQCAFESEEESRVCVQVQLVNDNLDKDSIPVYIIDDVFLIDKKSVTSSLNKENIQIINYNDTKYSFKINIQSEKKVTLRNVKIKTIQKSPCWSLREKEN